MQYKPEFGSVSSVTDKISEWKDYARQVFVDHPDLSSIEDEYIRLVTAVLIRNEIEYFARTHYEQNIDVNIKLIKKVVPNLLHFKLVSVQPLISPNGEIDFSFGQWSLNEPTISKVRKLKARPTATTDAEVEVIAQCLINELNNELLTDIRNNAGTIATWTPVQPIEDSALLPKILEVNWTIIRKTLSQESTKHHIMGRHIFDKWKSRLGGIKEISSNLYRMSIWSSYIHIVDSYLHDDILFFHRYDGYAGSSYVYSPYVFIGTTPVAIDPDWCFCVGYLTRYGKKLERSFGAKCFAKLTIGESHENVV